MRRMPFTDGEPALIAAILASPLLPSFNAGRPKLRPDLSGGDFPNDRKAGEPWSTVAA